MVSCLSNVRKRVAIRRAVAKEIDFIQDFIDIMNERCHFEVRIPQSGPCHRYSSLPEWLSICCRSKHSPLIQLTLS